MRLKVLHFIALMLTALALVPAGAHLFALPNKIGLAQEPYFIVQGIYRGWSLFGFVLIPALLANAALAFLTRERAVRGLVLNAALLLAANLAIFFTWTYPANQATANWTVAPGNWDALRLQWEYSHAANAVLTFCALVAVALAALLRRD